MEQLYEAASKRMMAAGYNRTKKAISNRVGRKLRAEFDFDERKNKRPDALQTGVIGGVKVGRYKKANP